MKIVKMKGGLGNQMFQYAFAKFLEKELDEEVRLDFHQYKGFTTDSIRKPRLLKYQISLDFADSNQCGFLFPHKAPSTSFLYKIEVYAEKKLNKKYYFTKGLIYETPSTLSTRYYFDGYWQSHKYVECVQDILNREFVPNYKLSTTTQNMIEDVSLINSVFVGVRKGDYTKNKAMRASWGSFNESYYHTCMNYIKKKVSNPVFIIFSNDVEWCKANLDFTGYNYEYREASEVVDDFEELQIMMACKHSIIVNSTFHWWGAWLHDNPEKIICCPQNWYFNRQKTEILPPSWRRF